MYTPANPFFYIMWDIRGHTSHGHVILMFESAELLFIFESVPYCYFDISPLCFKGMSLVLIAKVAYF